MFLNYKLQITNYKKITNHKLQITNKEVSFGQILNAFGEKQQTVFLSPIGLFVILDIVIWDLFVICDLYFVIF
ncbi:MAG: hypothetical protein JSV88_06535, partial [Candidatus Aminicenantes bacterium]